MFANIDPDKDDYLDEDFMHFNAVPSQSPENPWEVNHTYDAVLSYMGITTNVKVNIVPNPVTNVKFERDGSGTLTLYEGVDGETDREWDVDEGEIEYFRYYFQGFKKGDSITVTKNGGMNKYVYREIYTDYDGYIRIGGRGTAGAKRSEHKGNAPHCPVRLQPVQSNLSRN